MDLIRWEKKSELANKAIVNVSDNVKAVSGYLM